MAKGRGGLRRPRMTGSDYSAAHGLRTLIHSGLSKALDLFFLLLFCFNWFLLNYIFFSSHLPFYLLP